MGVNFGPGLWKLTVMLLWMAILLCMKMNYKTF